MVIGRFDSPNHAAVCLSNLAEEDFAPSDLSVIMKTREAADAIATASGSFHGLSPDDLAARLRSLGMPPVDAEVYRVGALNGGVVIVVSADDADDAAAETLRDHGATAVRQVKRS